MTQQPTPLANSSDGFWEYLLEDYLELACFLKEEERGPLLEEFRAQGGIAADRLEVYPCASLDNYLVVISERNKFSELWIYSGREKEIQKYKLV